MAITPTPGLSRDQFKLLERVVKTQPVALTVTSPEDYSDASALRLHKFIDWKVLQKSMELFLTEAGNSYYRDTVPVPVDKDGIKRNVMIGEFPGKVSLRFGDAEWLLMHNIARTHNDGIGYKIDEKSWQPMVILQKAEMIEVEQIAVDPKEWDLKFTEFGWKWFNTNIPKAEPLTPVNGLDGLAAHLQSVKADYEKAIAVMLAGIEYGNSYAEGIPPSFATEQRLIRAEHLKALKNIKIVWHDEVSPTSAIPWQVNIHGWIGPPLGGWVEPPNGIGPETRVVVMYQNDDCHHPLYAIDVVWPRVTKYRKA